MLSADAPVAAVPGAARAVPGSAHPSQGILLGDRGDMGAVLVCLSSQAATSCCLAAAAKKTNAESSSTKLTYQCCF